MHLQKERLTSVAGGNELADVELSYDALVLRVASVWWPVEERLELDPGFCGDT